MVGARGDLDPTRDQPITMGAMVFDARMATLYGHVEPAVPSQKREGSVVRRAPAFYLKECPCMMLVLDLKVPESRPPLSSHS